ncbi:MAG TPA: ABC transporter permease, partial [Vicinamibacterales bacterium]|nr:ABC transporter permease [Vicinamibacterales bacterium]
MRSGPAAQAMVVLRKELKDWSRDRRSIVTAVVGILFGPLFFAFMFNTMANRQRQAEDVSIPVIGAQHAPALMAWLRQQAGVVIVEGPADPEEAVRTGQQEVVVVIADDFAADFSASRPAQVRIVADSSNQTTRPKVQRVRNLLQGYSNQIGSLRLIARGISPVVASAVQIEDVEVSSAQQRAARIIGFLPVFILMAAFMGAMQIATDSTAGERERGSLEALLVNPAPRGAILAGKWLAALTVAIAAVVLSGTLLVSIFRSIPFQDLGLRFRLDAPQLSGMLAVLLPLCPLMVAGQVYMATFAKSFKEAQSYLSLLMMAVMLPGFVLTLYQPGSKTWMYFVPFLGQTAMMTDVLGGKPASWMLIVGPALISLGLAAVAVKAT